MKKSNTDAVGQRMNFTAFANPNKTTPFLKKSSVCALAVATFLLFTACTPPCPPAPKPETIIVREYITLPAPEPEIPQRPTLPSAELKNPTLQELVKALLADRELLKAWGLDLETRLKAYLQTAENAAEKEK